MRLGKQRLEAYQILRTLTGESQGWKYHPCVKMWKGHEVKLAMYGHAVCEEWISRNFKDTLRAKFEVFLDCYKPYTVGMILGPEWLGNKKFHASHRSNLLRKDKTFYSQYGWKEPDNLPYVWPV